MLSTRIFTSSSAAAKYYAHGDYYGSEGEGVWFGKGAEELNLTGEFKANTDPVFNSLLQGIMPNGQILGRKSKEKIEHCPGIDLTFSAPKSFSIQMLLYSNSKEKQAMEKALSKAVKATLSYIEEKGYVFTRKGHAGKQKEAANKLIFASFLHTTNRNLEPQAHIHNLLANAALRSDDKYRSISFEHILEHNKFFGQIFRNELALETKKLGHKITPTILADGSSSFELENIHPKLIEVFSTRRKEIEALCKLYDIKTKEGRDRIVINSRKAKRLDSQDNLTRAWHVLAEKVNAEIIQEKESNIREAATTTRVNHAFTRAQQFIKNTLGLLSNSNKAKEGLLESFSIKDLASLSVEDVTCNKSVFTSQELAKKLLKFSMGEHNVREIDSQLQQFVEDGTLIKHKDEYTSKDLLTQEKAILKHAASSKSSSKILVEAKYFDINFEKYCMRERARNLKFTMNKQQIEVVKHILNSQDKIITIVGLPGVGKSTVLHAVRDIAQHKINRILSLSFTKGDFEGLAPTASAAKSLGNTAKVESNTIHRFLAQHQGYLENRGKNSLQGLSKTYKDTILFIDEASLISTNIMDKLTRLQAMLKFRMILVGDPKQLGSVEAGKPFEQMLKILPPIILKEIVRQSKERDKMAVIAASQGRVKQTFAIHQQNIKVDENLKLSTSRQYIQSDQKTRDNTLLISPSKKLRDDINYNIRNMLQEKQSLKGQEVEFVALRAYELSKAELRFASSFKAGLTLRFNKAYKNMINKNEYLRIQKINVLGNNLLLIKENGKEVIFNLQKHVDYKNKFEVFEDKNLKLQEGLKLIFTKNNKEYGLINSETANIKGFNKNRILLEFENKSTTKIPLSNLKHIDYGYCVTVHSSQGKTVDNTIAAIQIHPLLNDQKSWLVSLSRHRDNLTIYVEDSNQLKTNLENNTGSQMSALELEAKINRTNIEKTAINDDFIKAVPISQIET